MSAISLTKQRAKICSSYSRRRTGRSRGFGFIEMSSTEEGQAAIRQFNGHEVGGRALNVNEAKPREDRGGRNGGGNGGGRGGYGGSSRY